MALTLANYHPKLREAVLADVPDTAGDGAFLADGNLSDAEIAVLTRLDVLDGFETVKICVRYIAEDGTETDDFPGGVAALGKVRPVFEEMPGWDKPTAGARRYEDLPQAARDYVERLQELIGCPVDVISTGPHRDETVMVRRVVGD